ncbi:M12 family metallopeptidase [Mesorhizobium sp. M0808]|uniref:M12 family metallopeptidase n=1 Tax=unclassified Mesorhizobium TaxID=325217 RepID=UPI00333D7DA7
MAENPKHYCMCLAGAPKTGADKTGVSFRKAAVLKEAMWDDGALITCRFVGGSAALQARVRAVAKEWENVANLTLDFRATGPTDVRIAFVQGNGSWSYLGTVCRQIPEPRETMNYGWLDDGSSEDVLRRVVLHEFGHAVGLIHEHQNPLGGIKWNRDAVIADLSGPPNNWDLATIENNMFHHYPDDTVIASPVDSLSIMMYPIPKAWTLDGFSAGMNSELSKTDRQLVSQAYPK